MKKIFRQVSKGTDGILCFVSTGLISGHVRFGSKADIPVVNRDIGLTSKGTSGMSAKGQ
jgi:hypothetical protein